jgi:mRNA-degrading endonuclease RelE of RelBE toxin-antitoxin system
MSPRFLKEIVPVDARLRGRILLAVAAICEAPLTAQGDTVKPLEKDLKGLWRYRIGDYRLVYRPDRDERRVTLMWFDSRGGAYS